MNQFYEYNPKSPKEILQEKTADLIYQFFKPYICKKFENKVVFLHEEDENSSRPIFDWEKIYKNAGTNELEKLKIDDVAGNADFAARIKTLIYRLFSKGSKERNLCCKILNNMRNAISHKTEEDRQDPYYDEKFYKTLEEFIENFDMFFPGLEKKVYSDAFEELTKYKEKLAKMSKNYTIDINNNEPISIVDLYSYVVLIDDDAITGEYGNDFLHNIINELSCIYVVPGVIESIKRQADRDKNINKQIPQIKNFLTEKKIINFGNISNSPDVLAETIHKRIIEKLHTRKGTASRKICVITGSKTLYRKIKKLQQEEKVPQFRVVTIDGVKTVKQSIEPLMNEFINCISTDDDRIKNNENVQIDNFSLSENDIEVIPDPRQINFPKVDGSIYLEYAESNVQKEFSLKSCRNKQAFGGEGSLYDISSAIGTRQNDIAKIYRFQRINTKEKYKQCTEKLTHIVKVKYDNQINRICLPKALARNDANSIVGFVMPYVKDAITVDELVTQIRNNTCELVKTRKELLDICIKIAELFSELHQIDNSSVLMADVNSRNIMIDNEKKIYFIDVDSYQWGKYCCSVGTDEYSSPAVIDNLIKFGNYEKFRRTPEDEQFSIAVLFFFILFLGKFPRNDINEYIFETDQNDMILKNLSKNVQTMFFETFVKDERYDENKWIESFTVMINDIDKRLLSNELHPFSCAKSKNDKFSDEQCSLCGKNYEVSKSYYEKSVEKLCPECQHKKRKHQSVVFTYECSYCKQVFSANEWDIANKKINRDKPICPDCSKEFDLSVFRNHFYTPNNPTNIGKMHLDIHSSEFLEKLQRIAIDALENAKQYLMEKHYE